MELIKMSSPVDNVWRPDLQENNHWQARRRFKTPAEPENDLEEGIGKQLDSLVFVEEEECQERCDELND